MSKKSVNQIITERIIERIQTTGELPWSKPWTNWKYKGKTAPAFNLRGTPYRGMNSVLLAWLPYSIPVYASFRQIQDLGGKVKRGEKSHVAVFFTMIEKTDVETGEEIKIPLLRYYNVWNVVEQCEGLGKKIPELQPAGGCGIPDAERIVENYQNRPQIIHKAGAGAAYYPMKDIVTMPLRSQFHSEAEYFSTVFHELGHSTGSTNRLNRSTLTGGHKFGSKPYSYEELVAELCSCYLCGLAGIEKSNDNSAAYLQSWLKCLEADPSLLGKASALAQKAFDYITNEGNSAELPEAEAIAA